MQVFLCWSGERSKAMAEALKDWLPQVVQAVKPWISSSDIDKGSRWITEMSDTLKETQVGIVCLTRENLDAKWILYEAGALSKTEDARVCTFLLDIEDTDLEYPLAQFQHTRFEKEDVKNYYII